MFTSGGPFAGAIFIYPSGLRLLLTFVRHEIGARLAGEQPSIAIFFQKNRKRSDNHSAALDYAVGCSVVSGWPA